MTGFAFTPAVLQRIPRLVARGYDVARITGVLGCELASLVAICGKHGISLKPDADPAPEFLPIEDCRRRRARVGAATLTTGIADDARAILLREADRRGVTAKELAACLLELVARDNLYGAILDK